MKQLTQQSQTVPAGFLCTAGAFSSIVHKKQTNTVVWGEGNLAHINPLVLKAQMLKHCTT
jgi:hypothetical protein